MISNKDYDDNSNAKPYRNENESNHELKTFSGSKSAPTPPSNTTSTIMRTSIPNLLRHSTSSFSSTNETQMLHYDDSDVIDVPSNDTNDEDRGHTFRERRLTYTKLHINQGPNQTILDPTAAAAAAVRAEFGDIDFSDDDDESINGTHRSSIGVPPVVVGVMNDCNGSEDGVDGVRSKRKLEAENVDVHAQMDDHAKRVKRLEYVSHSESGIVSESVPAQSNPSNSDGNADAPPNTEELKGDQREEGIQVKDHFLETRILHSGAPPIPSKRQIHRRSRLYRNNPAPHPADPTYNSTLSNINGNDEACENDNKDNHHQTRNELNQQYQQQHNCSSSSWKKRREFKNNSSDESKLPFPRSVVGTYSCHGVEPLYDSDNDHQDSIHPNDDADSFDENGNENLDTKRRNSEHSTALDSASTAQTSITKPQTSIAKINQDRGGIAFPYGNCPRTALFAVYDGHGDGGELVAQFALSEIQRRLEMHPRFVPKTHMGNKLRNGSIDDNNNNGDKNQMLLGIKIAFEETFVTVDQDLKNQAEIEPLYAGCTACVLLVRGKEMIISNAGDSRAVLATRKLFDNTLYDTSKNICTGLLQAVDLSIDQNPDSPGEQSRIEKMGGFVSPPPEPGLSARVWLDSNYTQIGLAMARSIGDHAVKPVGVIAEPVVTTHTITAEDEFVILATDGVWEFVSSQEAVDIVSKCLGRGEGSSMACQRLIECAAAKWHEFEGDYRDDITAIVLRVQELWDMTVLD